MPSPIPTNEPAPTPADASVLVAVDAPTALSALAPLAARTLVTMTVPVDGSALIGADDIGPKLGIYNVLKIDA